MRLLTHSAVVHAQMQTFLKDVREEVASAATKLEKSKEFKTIFKTSVAGFAVLNIFGRRNIELIAAAAEVCRRIPILIACRQIEQANVDIRRFVELVLWIPYFTEHPVEWHEFRSRPWTGYVRYNDNPIEYSAHRELPYYVAYSRERSRCEKGSPLGEALALLLQSYAATSVHVHAAAFGVRRRQDMLSLDAISDAALRSFAKTHRAVIAGGLLLVAWALPNMLRQLPAMERSLFDWVLGKINSNAIHSETACLRRGKNGSAGP